MSVKKICLVIMVIGCLAGCERSDGPVRYDVQGSVTYQGAPVKVGRILFEPDATRGNRGPQGFAVIQDGKYDTTKFGGKGTIGGPHVVRVNGFDGANVSDDSPDGRPLFNPNEERVDLPTEDATMDFSVKSGK